MILSQNLLNIEIDLQNTENCEYKEDLSRKDVSSGYDPAVGDVACYDLWGNLAIYYHDAPYANGLITMGHIESG